MAAQGRGELVQIVVWAGNVPVGRGMVLLPGHEGYSVSAEREGSADVRDVFVRPELRRRGVARAIMAALESSAHERALPRTGLAVAMDEDAAPARALYAGLGYRHAHGPFISSSNLGTKDHPIPVCGVLTYLIREL